jgi:ubiquinone/menaquinone biosynthesis C-methylase UbiE
MRENPERFEGLAEAYNLYRPGYPDVAFDDLVASCGASARIALDLGAGPGNSTAGLRRALPDDWLVIAAEPGHDMRRVLSRRFAIQTGVQVIDACAEAVPLPAACAGMVVACTAFHWFDRAAFFAEARRVLAPGGVLALLRNRREVTPLIGAFDGYIAEHSVNIYDYARREKTKEPSVRALASEDGFQAAKSRTYRWAQEVECRGLIDLYLTRSTLAAIVRRIGLGQVMTDLGAIYTDHASGPVVLNWDTTVKWAQRRA